MKKSELTQITQLIEALVAKEVRKQLPTIIAETFQNMMGKQVVTEARQSSSSPALNPECEQDLDLKSSLKEMFAGVTPTQKTTPAQPAQQRKFTKDPVLNQILNETAPLSYHERSRGQSPAFLGQYQQAALAAGASIPGEIAEAPAMSRQPVVLREGQESAHQPMAEIPDGISALDVARSVPLAKPVAQALTRNYSQMMKIIDKKKKGVVA